MLLLPKRIISPLSNNISFVIDLNVVVLPLPLNPSRPNFSLFSNPKYRLFIALTFFLQHNQYVFFKPIIFVVNLFSLSLLILLK